MESYLQGQDLWEVVNGNEVRQPEAEDANGVLRKWRIKAGKAMFALKTTVEDDVLEHIRDAATPKVAWDTFTELFSKKNDTKLQLLESELLSVAQRDLTIAQYFHKVKTLCREISELDPDAPIGDTRMKRIIIHGLKPEFRSYVAAIQGWQNQPSLVEFENLLAKAVPKKNDDKAKGHDDESSSRTGGGLKSHSSGKKFSLKCYNCHKKGHLARDCRSKKVVESNNVTSKTEDEWDFEASFAADEEEFAFATITSDKKIDYDNDWIVDSGCSNHMTGDKEKLKDVSKYTGSRVVVMANNSKLPIAHVSNTVVSPLCNDTDVSLKDVFHVPGMKKNLMSVAQLTSPGQYVLFGPQDVKVYQNLEVHGDPVMMGQRMESVYVMSAETAYVDKARRNETADLWHMRLSHVSYFKLEEMMKKSMLKGLLNLEVRTETVCEGCQYGKAHRLPYEESKFKAKEPLELIHSDVFGPVYFMKNKSDTLAKFKEFKKSAEAEIVRHQFTCANTPQQNGVSERKNRHLTEICRSMLHAKNVLGQFWAEAMKTAAYSSNNEADSGVFKEALEDSHIQLTIRDDEASDSDQHAEVRVGQNPWHTGVYQRHEEDDPNQPQVENALRRSTRTRKPNPKYANVAIVETDRKEPDTFEEAFQNTEWRKAMEEKLDALERNQTWELSPKPKDVKPISCKWVYKIKRRTDRSVERYKVRLVARGFSQQYGLDYDETFNPVAKLTTVRVLLALAASKSWNLWQMDVKNAFLHGELDREIYMNQPTWFQSQDHPEYVCKLRKALYGHKQAPRARLFVKSIEGKLAVVLVYVDDLIITGDCEEKVLQTKKNLSIRFQMKELGHLKHFLGLEVDYSEEGMVLHQQKYSRDLLKKFGMTNSKPNSTPMEPKAKMCAYEGQDLEDATMYRQLVGDHDTRRSTSGYVCLLGSGAISWCSKRQPTVSLSTTEAEYRASTMTAQEITWIMLPLKELHQPTNYSVPLYCDNLSAIRLAENPIFYARTKHVEVHHHFIREKVLQGEINLKHVGTDGQVADLFTKGMNANKLENFNQQLGMAKLMEVGVEREC
ncbi:PLAC8 family protein [Tanacetum coccineum]